MNHTYPVNAIKDLFGGIGALVVIVGMVAGASIGGYCLYAYLPPKYEATRRDVMIESRAYSEGTVRALDKPKKEYEAASFDISATAKHEFSISPADRLPPDLTQVGMPAVVHFTEKRFMKMLYELRDNKKLATVTYIVDLNGKLHKLCDSAGYGLPYSTQYSNPHRLSNPAHSQSTALGQPEPNGLFMPASADGTWIMCLNPETKALAPVYAEPRVIVSPFPLKAAE